MIAQRLAAQQLTGPPAETPEDVARRLLAVQAQDPRGARLAVRSRSAALTAADVDASLNNRSMLITWLNRGTLHLVCAEDYWWLHPLTTPKLATGNRRRLIQEGVTEAQADRGVDVITEAVRAHGPQTRSELREHLDAARVSTAGAALVHLLFAAALQAQIVRGPMRGKEHAFVATSDWLGDPPEPLERPNALALLARRYLVGHGPADARDLAKWAGITLGDARAGIEGINADLIEQPDGLVDLVDRVPSDGLGAPRLLGPFDPLLLGWASREPFVGAHSGIVTSNGLFRACALVDGHVVATWGLSGTTLTLRLLEKVAAKAIAALRADATDVLRFLGLPEHSDVLVETEDA